MISSTELRKDAAAIFRAGLKAADPRRIIPCSVRLDGNNRLVIAAREYNLDQYDRITVIGAGKASAAMAAALENILGSRIDGGLITTKYGHGLPLKFIKVQEAGHPVPDRNGLLGAERILELVEAAGNRDLILCLISGGGSALMPLPVNGVSLADKQETTRLLLSCGAPIQEVNAVRKHISRLKGGKLAKASYPATVITLILSDVVGDDLDAIASGPTVPDQSTFQECIEIIQKYDLIKRIPSTVRVYLESGMQGKVAENPKPGSSVFIKNNPFIIGSSRLSLAAACSEAGHRGYRPLILSSFIEGETREVAKVHAAIMREIVVSGHPLPRPACVLSGGETTVKVRGSGLGGRNTEFALACGLGIEGLSGVMVLSGGTDGTDGPTDAAGAFVDGTTAARARKRGLDPLPFLENNDSYTFFKNLDDLFFTGPTMTNVMDLRILLVK